MAILNQYSFVIFSSLFGLALAAVMWQWRAGAPLLRVGIVALYVLGAVAFGGSRRYPQEELPLTLAQVEAALDNGSPTFIMLYSNY